MNHPHRIVAAATIVVVLLLLLSNCQPAVAQPYDAQRFELADPVAAWKTVRFSRSNNKAGQVFMWHFPDPGLRDVLVEFLQVESDKYLPRVPIDAQGARESHIGIWFTQDYPGTAVFTFRYKRADDPPLVIPVLHPTADNDNKGWMWTNFTADDLPSTRIVLRAPNDSCIVSLDSVIVQPGGKYIALAFPFGFNPTVAYPDGSSPKDDGYVVVGESPPGPPFWLVNTLIHSHGKDLGIELEPNFDPIQGIPENSTLLEIKLRYSAYCPKPLEFSSPHPTQWVKVTLADAHRHVLIPSPSVADECWTEIVVLTSYGLDESDDYYAVDPQEQGSVIRVTCPGKTTAVLSTRSLNKFTDCPPHQPLIFQAIGATAVLAFRQRCPLTDPKETSSDPPYVPALPGHGVILEAKRLERDLTESPDRTAVGVFRRAWTISAMNPNCRVRLDFRKIDVDRVAIYEDFQDRNEIYWGERVQTIIAIGGDSEQQGTTNDVFSKYKNGLTYISCLNRVHVEIPNRRWFNDVVGWLAFQGTYQQECRPPQTGLRPPCGTFELALEAGWDWSTFVYTAINLNQAKTTQIIIKPNITALSPNDYIDSDNEDVSYFIELDFVSLVQQTWVGHSLNFEWYGDQVSETHNVYIARRGEEDEIRKRAAVGQNEFVKLRSQDDAVVLSTDVILPKGHHIYTVKYRLVRQRHDDVDGTLPVRRQPDRVLVASRQPKTLEFSIPSAFSHESRTNLWNSAEMIRLKKYLREYENEAVNSMMINQWAFRHRWIVQAENSSCRVAIRFTRMDIGTGYVIPPHLHYVNNQHRLFILPSADNGIPPKKSFDCSDAHPFVPNVYAPPQTTTTTICSRRDTNYISPGSSLGIVFQSTTYDEYEVFNAGNYPSNWTREFLSPFSGVETTWGSGWNARYWQVCSANEIQEAEKLNAPTLLRATRRWSSHLPETSATNLLLYATQRYEIRTTSTADDCQVEFYAESFEDNAGDVPLMVYNAAGTLLTPWTPSSAGVVTGKSDRLMVEYLGRSAGLKYFFKYREVCP